MSDVVHSQALPTKHDKKDAGEEAGVWQILKNGKLTLWKFTGFDWKIIGITYFQKLYYVWKLECRPTRYYGYI